MGLGAKATQLAGNYAIPGTYPNGFATIKQAVDSLNGLGISSAVTINIASGYTENEIVSISLGSAILNNTLNSTNTLTFKKSGVGQNPLIIAYVGTISNNVVGTMGDCIFSLNGCDYVTIDGIDVSESVANTTATTQMEFGYAFYKLNSIAPFDGCQNNTIKNCSITLNQANIYSVGILFGNTKRNSFATIIPASTFDANNYNKIYNNAIQNVYSGIYFKGFNDTAATPNQTLYDTGNDIGGYTITTGNTITNWGGDFSTYPFPNIKRYGIYCINQIQLKISFNSISNINHFLPPINTNFSTKNMYGICLEKNGENFIIPNNVLIKENTVELKPIMHTIDSMVGVAIVGYRGGLNISKNEISFNQKISVGSAYELICFSVYSNLSSTNSNYTVPIGVDMIFSDNTSENDTADYGNFSFLKLGTVGHNNFIKNNSLINSALYRGTLFLLTHRGTADSLVFDNNIISNIVFSIVSNGLTQTGSIFCVENKTTYSVSNYESYSNNIIKNITAPVINVFQQYSTGNDLKMESNIITNLFGRGMAINVGGGGGYGINNSLTLSNNKIKNIAAGGTGIAVGGTFLSTKVTKNSVTDLSSSNAFSTGCKGIYIFTGHGVKLKNDDISNNIIGNFSTPFSTSSEAQIGMEIVNSNGVNVQNNTIYLNGTVPNNLFGSVAIKMFGIAAPQSIILRNNLIINATNNVGANPTGIIYGLKMVSSGTNYSGCSDSSNNNIWYVGNPSSTHLIYSDGQGINHQTLQSLQTAIYPRERNSKTENTLLFTSNPASSNYLHVNNCVQTLAESGGVFDSIVKDDFDGNIRFGNIGYAGNGTAPDIGAGEFNITISNVKINAGRDTFICGSNGVILGGNPTANNGSGHYHYKWNPSTGLNNDTIANPVAILSTSTNFVVSVYDSISNLTFKDTVNIRSSSNIINQTICNNQPYFFKGLNLLTAGTYIDTLTSILGCDSIITLNLRLGNPSFSTLFDTICIGDNYYLNNKIFDSAGLYFDTLINYTGCDSIITLNLFTKNCNCSITNFSVSNVANGLSSVLINATPNGNFIPVLSTNSRFQLSWYYQNSSGGIHGFVQNTNVLPTNLQINGLQLNTNYCYTFSGVCLHQLTTVSSPTICVTVCNNKPTAGNIQLSKKAICVKTIDTISLMNNFSQILGLHFQWYKNGALLPIDTNNFLVDSTIISSSNYYCIITCINTGLSDTSNIDTIIVLNSSSNINQTICSNQSYFFNGNNLTSTGTYLDTLTNYLGCDSIITLNLTVHPISSSTINQTACNNYFFNNQTLTASGTYYDTLTNYLGCDSIVTLNLIVNQKPTAGFSVQNFNIGQPTNFIDSSFLFSANSISQYLWSFGDSINMQTSNAQNPLHTYSVSGNYLVQLIVNDINGCGDTSQQLVAINNCINAPNIISTNIFPAGTQCVSIARLVTAIVNFNTSIQKNVWLKYSINGVLQTSILASNISGNIYSCTMPSSTPTNGKIIWWITADTGNICSSGMYGGMYQDSNFVNLIATSTASANPICLSSSTLLNYTFNGSGNNYTYTWFDGISIIGSSNPIAVNPTINTSYNLIVKDTLNQCFINSNQIFVTVINPTLSFAALSQSCFNPTTCVSLNMNANNGVAPYTFNASSLHGGAYNSTNQTICWGIAQQDTITVIVTDAMGCTAMATDTIKLSTDCVWPGDANSDLVANNLDIFPIGLLNGTTGPVRNNASLVWIDQPATPYGISASGFANDAKHADCNGDGIIDGNDTTAILQNYGLTHLRKKSGADLMTLTIGPDTCYQNTTATIHIGLGTAALPMDSVYGVAFSFNVDPTAIDTNSININTPASWLFNNNTDHFQIYKISKSATRVDVGLVRNNHISKSGFGDVVTVTVDITTGNIIGREDAMAAYNKKYQLHCSVDNITILKLDGSMISANLAEDSSLILYTRPDGINNILSQNLSQSI
ncbi:MAG: hypothetical protein RL708_1271, partial [Bacteroidota bacterium]